MKVYKAINAVQTELAREGISKNRVNQQQHYKFRGIDDVYNALANALATHGLCVLPRMISREVTERASSKGGMLFYVVVEAEFDFVASEDGSKHTVRTYGEAMDSADKATNKAMSAAYKYAAMQSFCIPTEGDNDADATTHEVAAASKPDPRIGKFQSRLTACAELGELEGIGGELALSGIKGADLDTLRKLYASRRRAIVAAEDQAAAADHPEDSQ